MALRLVARPSGILVPRDDFGLKGQLPGDLIFGEDIGYVAALNLGYDGNQPRLQKLDAAGNLRVTLAGQTVQGGVDIQKWQGVLTNAPFLVADATNPPASPYFYVYNSLYNGATWDRGRAASAANLAANLGLGTALTSSPGEWSGSHNPAVGIQASFVKTAGAAGVRHIARSIDFGFSSSAALAGVATVVFTLLDGGAIMRQWTFDLPAAVIAPFSIQIAGLNLVGTAATSMTINSDAAHAGLRVYVNMSGYDAS